MGPSLAILHFRGTGGWRENEIGCDYVQAAGHIGVKSKIESRKLNYFRRGFCLRPAEGDFAGQESIAD